MAAAVMCDGTEAVLRKEEHLLVPHIAVQRSAVRERHDRTFAPVLKIDLGAVFGGDGAHRWRSLLSAPAGPCECFRKPRCVPFIDFLVIRESKSRGRGELCEPFSGSNRRRP